MILSDPTSTTHDIVHRLKKLKTTLRHAYALLANRAPQAPGAERVEAEMAPALVASSHQLRDRVLVVFPLYPKPSYTLSDALIDDDYGDTARAFEEKWVNWTQIKDWQVDRCQPLFSYAGDDAVYYIPRWMLFVLDHMTVPGFSRRYEKASDDALLWYLRKHQKTSYANLYLTPSQIVLVNDFLEFVRFHDDYRV